MREVEELRTWAELTNLPGVVRGNQGLGFDIITSNNDAGYIVDGIRVLSTDPADRRAIKAISVAAIRNGETVAHTSVVGAYLFDLGAEAISRYKKL